MNGLIEQIHTSLYGNGRKKIELVYDKYNNDKIKTRRFFK